MVSSDRPLLVVWIFFFVMTILTENMVCIREIRPMILEQGILTVSVISLFKNHYSVVHIHIDS